MIELKMILYLLKTDKESLLKMDWQTYISSFSSILWLKTAENDNMTKKKQCNVGCLRLTGSDIQITLLLISQLLPTNPNSLSLGKCQNTNKYKYRKYFAKLFSSGCQELIFHVFNSTLFCRWSHLLRVNFLLDWLPPLVGGPREQKGGSFYSRL